MNSRATDLEIVDTPRGERLCINGFVTDRAWVATTCHGACARIDTELEAQVMHFVCCSLNAFWESEFESVGITWPKKAGRSLGEVGQQLVCNSISASHLRPTVVRVDIFVAGGLETLVFHGIGCLQDTRLIDVTAIGVLKALSVHNQ
jgi:hypothetical protein